MAAETGFMIDGTLYEVPDLGSFTMDEIQVLYDYSSLTLEDFIEGENETADEAEARELKLRNPGFMRALMHVAYQRGNNKLPTGRVKQIIGSANVITALETLGELEVEDDVPLGLTSEPNGSSLKSSLENDSTSELPSKLTGPVSTRSLGEPESPPFTP